VKLVHQVGLITKKFATMHGHMNVKRKTVKIPTVLLRSSRVKERIIMAPMPRISHPFNLCKPHRVWSHDS